MDEECNFRRTNKYILAQDPVKLLAERLEDDAKILKEFADWLAKVIRPDKSS